MTRRKRWAFLIGGLAVCSLAVGLFLVVDRYAFPPPDWVAQVRPGMTFDDVMRVACEGVPSVALLQKPGSDVREIHRDGWVLRTRYQGDRVTWVHVSPPESPLLARIRRWLGL
jgi:hypothetical protein